MDHSAILAQFMNLSGKDIDECRAILESVDWDLEVSKPRMF